MSIYDDFLSSTKRLAPGMTGITRALYQEVLNLAAYSTPDYPPHTAAVQASSTTTFTQETGGVMSGTFTLEAKDGDTSLFSVGPINYDASILDIYNDLYTPLHSRSLDTDDYQVTGDPPSSGVMVFTFIDSLASFADWNWVVSGDDIGITVTSTVNVAAVAQNPALGILVATGVVTYDGTTIGPGSSKSGPHRPTLELVRVLAAEAALAASDHTVESRILSASGDFDG